MLKKINAKNKSILKYSAALILLNAVCIALVYFYNVFYSYGQYPIAHIPSNALLLLFILIANLGFAVFTLARKFCNGFENKAAIAIFFIGLLYVFVSPPLQVPDENVHYMRSVSLSYGNFDYNAQRTYPETVDATLQAFYSAFTNSNDGTPLKVRTDNDTAVPPSETFSGTGIINQYIDYYNITNDFSLLDEQRRNTEPVLFITLAFVPQAIGVFLARLLGFGGLGMLYGARIFALLAYTVICRAALLNCKRYKALFLSFMLMPLTLFMAASCSYDSIVLALCFFVASYFCKDEIQTKDVILFLIATIFISSIKINNILWVFLILILPKHAYKTKIKKWQTALIGAAFFAFYYGFNTVYNMFAINGFGEIGRMLDNVSPSEQIQFVLSNFVSVIARFWGTVFENDFFLSQLGVFGTIDTPIALINILSPIVLLLAAVLCVNERSSLPLRSSLGLLVLGIFYTASIILGIYIAHTPVGMVRVIGLQARYFIPAYLIFSIVICAALSHVLMPSVPLNQKLQNTAKRLSAQNVAFYICVFFGILGALLLFETYFIGPVAIVPMA